MVDWGPKFNYARIDFAKRVLIQLRNFVRDSIILINAITYYIENPTLYITKNK